MNLTNFRNERFGYNVVTNGTFVAVGNPPLKKYSEFEDFTRAGEICLYKKNRFEKNYSFVRSFTKPNLSDLTNLYSVYAEQSSSAARTGSIVQESGSKSQNLTTCSLMLLEGSEYNLESYYGISVDLSDYFMVIGDPAFSQSFERLLTTSGSSVEIYRIANSVAETDGCLVEENETYEISNLPFCFIKNDERGFGKVVSIGNEVLVVSAPDANNGRGKVFVYRYDNTTCDGYVLESTLSSSDSTQYGFGTSISLDKYNEDKILIANSQISPNTSSIVHLYKYINGNWGEIQTFSKDIDPKWIKNQLDSFGDTPPYIISQSFDRFGHSVSIYDKVIAIGAPSDVTYYQTSASVILHQEGAFYLYALDECTTSGSYNLVSKYYGGSEVFKDNLYGYSVSVYDNKILVGSPKPYFPFSSLYISSSVNQFNKNIEENTLGAAQYLGQAFIYNFSNNTLNKLTTRPIAKRKTIDYPFSAFGSSVSLSSRNLVIGSPVELNNDFYLNNPIISESIYSSGDCGVSTASYFLIEQSASNSSNQYQNIVLVEEQDFVSPIKGRSFIYDFENLSENLQVGNVFYNNNKIVVNNTGSILQSLLRDPVNYNNPYYYIDFNSLVTLRETQYICTIDKGEFNVSTNPTSYSFTNFDYGIINKMTFDFDNLDIVLRYIIYKNTTPKTEEWWNYISFSEGGKNIFDYYVSLRPDFYNNKLTQKLLCELNNINFDVNNDGKADLLDLGLIWKYWIGELNVTNFSSYINPLSKNKTIDQILSFLNDKTGKFVKKQINNEFFKFNYSSSVDPTGSYLAPYITQVGLYSGTDLVALAKLAHPIKNTGQYPINIIVKWDT